MAAVLVPAMSVPVLAPPAAADPGERSVRGTAVPALAAQPSGVAARAVKPAQATWPEPGTADLTLPSPGAGLSASAAAPRARAGNLPLWIGQSPAAGPDPAKVRAELLGRSAAVKAGVPGLLFTLRRADGQAAAGPVSTEFDYSGFRTAYGADYGSRLALVKLPGCALTTPEAAKCRAGTPIATRNDSLRHRLTADLSADGAGQVYAVTAQASGSAGSLRPTKLAPSATWSVGVQSGDFSWQYPISVPPAPGLSPDLELDYSSGTVDGRTASTNNQPGWLGEGFTFEPGFVERQFVPCGKDGTPGSGDLCWGSASAHVSLPGLSGELVRDDTTGTWRVAQDAGWRVDRLTGAVNGDDGEPGDKGEHWKFTAPDGTQYFLGLNRLPGWTAGSAETKSAWTVPVYGNQAGEPCYQIAHGDAWCRQGYRFNLDYVVDPNGNAMAYYYGQELNHYGRNGDASAATPYVRGGQLARIEYGLRDGAAYAPPPAQVVFTPADRCVPGSPCVRSQPQDWPDTPLDQHCDSGSCGVYSPTFWTAQRLAKITTQVREGSGYSDVDSWTFEHLFPAPSDGTAPSLWLNAITRTGHPGPAVTLPRVTFDAVGLANRVDPQGSGLAELQKFRVRQINTETGGQIDVTYGIPGCAPGSLPAPDQNTLTCYPAMWDPGLGEPLRDWFNKYRVTRVVETDRFGGSPVQHTDYAYLGGAGWRYDESELTTADHKSWGQFRGYGRVEVRTGNPAGPRTLTVHSLYRGMKGDRLADGSARPAQVSGVLDTTPLPDEAGLRGIAREVATYNGDGGPLVSATVSWPLQVGPTATRDRPGGALNAYRAEVRRTQTHTAIAGAPNRVTEEKRTFDGLGRHTETSDLGDLATTADDLCTTTTYAGNQAQWIVNRPARTETVGAACGTTGETLSGQRYSYDGQAYGAAPVKGNVTRTEVLSAAGYRQSSAAVHDAHGRAIEQYDALNNKTTIAYTPAIGGPVAQAVTTNPLGHAATTMFDKYRGLPAVETDANGRQTQTVYDGLGRRTAVWLPGRARTDSASAQFEYDLPVSGAPSVTTKALQATGSYATSVELFDSFLRSRQIQQPSPAGGRIVTTTLYDTFGRSWKTSQPYHNTGAVAKVLLDTPDNELPGQTVTEYDGAGRKTAEIQLASGAEKWRTTTGYGGDRVHGTPPQGGTATTRVTDARGRLTELRQYHGGAPAGSFDATKYTYTRDGELSTVVDQAGNTWRYEYDIEGNLVRSEDPDQGVSTATYDAAGHRLTRTDARGRTLTYGYDVLGRKTSLSEGTTLLAGWAFDGPGGKGLPWSSTRYQGTAEYRTEVLGYDAGGRATGQAVVVPGVEGLLAGRYETKVSYNLAGQPVNTTPPAAGGLPQETQVHAYSPLGLPTTLGSTLTLYGSATYTNTGDLYRHVSGPAAKAVTRTFTTDPATGRVNRTQVTRTTAPTAVSDVNYTYDAAGNITKAADVTAGDTQCAKTDYLRRMTEAWTPGDGDCAKTPATTGLGGPAPYWHSYTYDVAGNRTSEVRHASAGDTTRTYGYAGGHTLRTVSGGSSFTHDASGNQTERVSGGVTQQLTWDAEGRLANLVQSGASSSAIYDADGNRLLRKDATGTTLYLGDTELKLSPGGTGVTGTRYYTHLDRTVAVRTAGKLTWLVADHHGTASAGLDSVTLAVTRRFSLPFGESRDATPPAWPGERGFVGGITDGTGLVHIGAREYDPVTGRFASADPVIDHEDPQQVNGYSYANNNPFSYSDPDGLKAKKKVKPASSSASGKKSSSGSPKPKPKTVKIVDIKKLPKDVQKAFKEMSKALKNHKPGKPLKISTDAVLSLMEYRDHVTNKALGKSGGGGDGGMVIDGDYVNYSIAYDVDDGSDGSLYFPSQAPEPEPEPAPPAPAPKPPKPCGGWSQCLPVPPTPERPPVPGPITQPFPVPVPVPDRPATAANPGKEAVLPGTRLGTQDIPICC